MLGSYFNKIRMLNEILDFNPSKITDKILSFIDNKVQEASLHGGIVSVSGGLDSTVTLVLTKMALGSENTFAVTMPECDVTPKGDITDVIDLAGRLDVTCDVVELNEILHVMANSVPDFGKNDKVALGNVKARIRMMISYYYANVLDMMVVGTSNKSELLTGFFTKYGDGGVDIMPLADLYKSQVKKLAKYLDIPEKIINKTPSPGFWPGHTDEDELGLDYNTLDQILYGLDEGEPVKRIEAKVGVSVDDINDIIERVKNNKHKRKTPPILTFNL